MRYEQQTVRIGERVGDVDWSYNFRSHFDGLCSTDERRDEACTKAVEVLRDIESDLRAGKHIVATTDGGWPRCGWGRVIDVGMYDGWPFWKPVPSVLTSGPLGPSWHSFYMITGVEIRQ